MRAWDHLPLPISRESYFIDPGESPDISTKTNKQTNKQTSSMILICRVKNHCLVGGGESGIIWENSIETYVESESVSHSVVSDSLRPHGLYPVRLLYPWSSPGKNTGVGSHSLLQRTFQPRNWTQVSCIADSLLSEPPGKLNIYIK